MKLLVVTTREDRSRDRLTEEAGKKGLEATQLYYEDIDSEKLGPEGFNRYDFCILRDPYNTGEDYSGIFNAILSFFREEQVLDYSVFRDYPEYEDKLFQHRLLGGIMDMPRFRHFRTPEDVDVQEFPAVIKKRISSRGRGIFVIKNQGDLERFLKGRDIEEYFIEQQLAVSKDIRILLIGNEIVGAVERRVRIKDNHGYDGVGVKVTGEYEVPGDVQKKAMEISKRISSDFCGIDIVFDKEGKPHLLECNISPQFVAFERMLGVNAAGKLIDFIAARKHETST